MEVTEVVPNIESASGRHRVRIVKLSGAAFRIDVERRFVAEDAGGLKLGECWAGLSGWMKYTDNLERAVELAAETIRWAESTP